MGESDRISKRVPLIFLHIPKAAGSTLHHILNREYESRETYDIDAVRMRESIEEFVKLPHEHRARIKLLKGHMPFGLHQYLTNPVTYITIIRDPIYRVVSHYYYVMRTPNHYLHNELTSHKMTMRDYVSSGISTELDNGQTRMIAGIDDGIGFGKCSKAFLQRALDNLHNHFAVVGLSERFDETLILMRDILGWRRFPFYIKRNVSKKRPLMDSIPKHTRDVIEKYNELDCELYECARKCFEEALSEKEHLIREELGKFVALNRIYQKYALPYALLWSILKRIKASIT